ncbi:MAG: N-6 DNA methylase [Spirochaetales bacterium]|nr:N-6 DNA methylase [Spirochaetales bacterium]
MISRNFLHLAQVDFHLEDSEMDVLGDAYEYLIREMNWLDAVIGLPANLFFGTGIPTVILVFKKCREHSANILFIDASANFEKVKNQNKLRPEDIDRILSTFESRKVIEKYSHAASLEEIVENEYNLNIPRYVDTFEEEEPVDLDAVVAELKSIEAEIGDVDKRIVDQCKELGIPAPVFPGIN